MLRKYFRFAFFSVVIAGIFPAWAGSFEDFFRAVRQDNVGEVALLLKRGFDPNTVDELGFTGLFIALRDDYPKVAKLLAEFPGTHPETRTPDGESTLMMACLRGEEAVAKRLVERGADVNKMGWAPLHYAASAGHTSLVAYLLDQNAYIDAESPNGTTPLMMAAKYGSPETVKLLLEAGADATLKNQLGLTALDFARQGLRPDAIEMLTAVARTGQKPKPPGKW